MSVALIKFLQGAVTGPNGQMIVGTVGNFTVANSNNAGVGSWQIDLVSVPPGSARSIAAPLAHNDNDATPTVVIAADVSGCYRIVLKVWNAAGRSGLPDDVDIRVFCVPEAQGTIVPPSQLDPPEIDPVKKPNEMNLGGNLNGWAGGGVGDGLLNDTLKKLDSGGFSGRLLVKVVVADDVANLAAFPSSATGYTFQNGDLLCLASQSNTSHNVTGTYNAGVFTPSVRQPNDGTQIIPTEGSSAYSPYVYRPGSVTLPPTTGAYRGVNTSVTLAPDAVGLKNVANEGDGRLTIPAGGAWTTIWQCDPVARGFATGRIDAAAKFLVVDGPKGMAVQIEGIFSCATATLDCQKTADITDDGLGPYINGRFIVVSGVLCAQLSNLTVADYQAVGISAFFRGSP